jgi:hypothetical protein
MEAMMLGFCFQYLKPKGLPTAESSSEHEFWMAANLVHRVLFLLFVVERTVTSDSDEEWIVREQNV